MSTRRSLAAGATAVLVAAVAIIAVDVGNNADEAHATLPPPLEQVVTSSRVDREVVVNPGEARKVTLDGGSEVFLVPGDDGDACIGLEDGSAACGPAADVAAGRLFLITVSANGEPGDRPSVVPATGSARAVVYGYQPDKNAAHASILGADRQVLGSGEVVDGMYRIEMTTDAHAKRMTEVRFYSANGLTGAPAPIDLDEPAG
jgi:hypothetical protein